MYKSTILSFEQISSTKCRTKLPSILGHVVSRMPGSLSFALQKRSPDLVQVLVTIFAHLKKSGRERWTRKSQGSAILFGNPLWTGGVSVTPTGKWWFVLMCFFWFSFDWAFCELQKPWEVDCAWRVNVNLVRHESLQSFRLSVFKCLITAISVSVAIGGVSLKFLPSVFSRIFFSGPLIHLSSGDPFGWFLGPTSLREHQLMLLMCKGVAHPADCPACVEAAWAKDVGQVLREAMISWIAFVIDFDVFESDSAWNNHDMKFLLYDPILAFLIWSHYRRTIRPESLAGPVVSILSASRSDRQTRAKFSDFHGCKMMHPWKS